MTFLLLISGAFVLTILHTILPEHWMPFVLVGKVQKWSTKKTLEVAALAATGHVLITIFLGFLVMFITEAALDYFGLVEKIVSGVILIGIGLIYLVLAFRKMHTHKHHDVLPEKATIGSLIALFSFSPCEAVIPLFILAADQSWFLWIPLSLTILFGTIFGMFVLISITLYGYRKIKLHWVEDNEKAITGALLMIIGVLALIF